MAIYYGTSSIKQDRVRFELWVIWKVIVRDIPAALLPILLFSLGAWHYAGGSLTEVVFILARSSLYAFMYTWTFCLSNQIAGIEEDRINKPDRPLASGAITYSGALFRWSISMSLFTALGYALGILPWVMLWQFVTVLHNLGYLSKYWFAKNLAMGLGTVAQLAGAWQLVTPLTPVAWNWILLLALVIFPLVSMQDLRDCKGDALTGRVTVPLLLGEQRTRFLLCLGFVALPILVWFYLIAPVGITLSTLFWQLPVTIISVIIAVRVITRRNVEADHHTYMLFCYWYCLLLSSTMFIL